MNIKGICYQAKQESINHFSEAIYEDKASYRKWHWGGFIARRSTAHLQPLHQAGVFCTLGHPPCPSAAHFERIDETARPGTISNCRKCDGGAKGKAAPLSEAERASVRKK